MYVSLLLKPKVYVCIRNGVGFFIRCNTDMAKAGISVAYFVFVLYICVWVYWGDSNKFMYVSVDEYARFRVDKCFAFRCSVICSRRLSRIGGQMIGSPLYMGRHIHS